MLKSIESFYRRFSGRLLLGVLLTLPLLAFEAARIPTNNDVETWLPSESDLKIRYDQFREDFGSEELIVVGFETEVVEERLIGSLTSRIQSLPGISHAWDSRQLRQKMIDLQVPTEAIQDRLIGMTESPDGTYQAILAVLSETGTKDRASVVHEIREELEYCQLQEDEYALAGGPVIIAELDRLGGPEYNRRFFLITLFLGFLVLYGIIGDWKTSAATILLTVWAIQATTTGVKWFSGEMNFILGALPVMVMVFTLATAIHFLHYYDRYLNTSHPIAAGLGSALRPCLFASLTTTIGLLSLGLSDIMPVRQFGYAASLGCIVSIFTALGLMPAVVTLCKFQGFRESTSIEWQNIIFRSIIRRRWLAIGVPLLFVAIAAQELPQLRSRLEPLEFLPEHNKVIQDFDLVQQKLTTLDSIELVVDFDGDERLFLDRLDTIREIENIVAAHRWVRRTSSPASFFPTPDQMPESTRAIGSLLRSAKDQSEESDYVACGQRFWRISARIEPAAREHQVQMIEELKGNLSDYPVTLTGLSPLIKEAQHQIFDGFWASFASAFFIISAVMMISLRSISAGLFAMVPNLSPLILVFGALAWMQVSIDIGMMMTASIALGIAVDGTFHFLVRYTELFRESGQSKEASLDALLKTGPAIAEAAVIAGVGMLALGLSPFAPTSRFGLLMSALLAAALVGDLVLLPALLAVRRNRKQAARQNDEESDLAEPDENSLQFMLRGPHRLDRKNQVMVDLEDI